MGVFHPLRNKLEVTKILIFRQIDIVLPCIRDSVFEGAERG